MTWHEMFGINLDFDTYKHLIYPVCGLQKRTMPTFYSCYTDEDCDCCPPSLTLRPCWAPISLWTIGTTTKTCLNVNMDVWELFQGRLENCEPVLKEQHLGQQPNSHLYTEHYWERVFVLHVLIDGLVPPQKLMTPFTISPARCSPLVSVPEPAPSSPRCCLRSARHHPPPDPSTAKNKTPPAHRSASTALTCHLRTTHLLYSHTTDFSTWVNRLGEGPLKNWTLEWQTLRRWVHFMLWIEGLWMWSCRGVSLNQSRLLFSFSEKKKTTLYT